MKCPNCTITRYLETAGEERTFSPSISREDGVCAHCGFELPLIDGIIDRLPDRPLRDEDVKRLQRIVGVVTVTKSERYVPALRPRTLFGLKNERFLVNQRVEVGLLDETVTYLWEPIEIDENGDDEIWKRGGWTEVERIETHWQRDPVPYALNEATPEVRSTEPNPVLMGHDPFNW